jgi:hypothetical protein
VETSKRLKERGGKIFGLKIDAVAPMLDQPCTTNRSAATENKRQKESKWPREFGMFAVLI